MIYCDEFYEYLYYVHVQMACDTLINYLLFTFILSTESY